MQVGSELECWAASTAIAADSPGLNLLFQAHFAEVVVAALGFDGLVGHIHAYWAALLNKLLNELFFAILHYYIDGI